MTKTWSFKRKIGTGLAVVVALTVLISAIAVYALNTVIASKDRVISENAQVLTDAARLDAALEWKVSAGRGFLLAHESDYIDKMKKARGEFHKILGQIRSHVDMNSPSQRLIDQIEQAEGEHQAAMDQVIALKMEGASAEAVSKGFSEKTSPRREVLNQRTTAFVSHEQSLLAEAKKAATDAAYSAMSIVIGMAIIVALFAVCIAYFLTRTLTNQIGDAVHHVQSSSAELQSAANQQASGAKEAAMAMTEITTTISELLATSRQIAESSQRVAHIAAETASSAREGDQTVQKTHDSVVSIQRQVDLIVTHMLELGKKSQQIGGILEIINELAEQTNILAINATIEAAGAGDSGKRFAIVADEIRKLADRVGGSTKEIKALIDEVRAAVNTTIMATESGSKAVDAGARQFSEVASALKQIIGMVKTTTEAAREIELSTKQQSTAVEQVNFAVSNVSQATRETEASSGQTLETATQLNELSRQLTRLILPNMSA
ncbi:HAMP domain-containing methyl-accepting chemotaxis protein [Oligoflexus tunisiensis]|uniref:HAMP domain-containing methyl-accepting chemotaxis protein n=1 Tax=Oligoflexus tunisiensis TaxID=708132 RepID=UPI000A484D9D|nr:methyl-accepting chemotaxis protein [Oligoflexus tunisiensis]